jgi:hypothetical protein
MMYAVNDYTAIGGGTTKQKKQFAVMVLELNPDLTIEKV